MATVNQMCQKALYLERGRVVSFDAVAEATTEYHRDVIQQIEGSAAGGWHRNQVEMPDPRIEVYTERTGEAELLGASIRAAGQAPASVLPLDATLEVEMRYRLTRDLAYPVVPNFHLYDEFGGRLFVTMPETLPPATAGEHRAVCILPPYLLNAGRFTVMVALSSFTQQPPVHFAGIEALRFEVSEVGVTDPRRHGLQQPLPGFIRPRLDWSYPSPG